MLKKDIEAAPYLAIAWLVWGFDVDLNQRILKQGEEETIKYIDQVTDKITNIFKSINSYY